MIGLGCSFNKDSQYGYWLPRAGMARLTQRKRMPGTVSQPFGKRLVPPTYGDSDRPSLSVYWPLACNSVMSEARVHLRGRCYSSVRSYLVLNIQLAHNIYLRYFLHLLLYIYL